MQISLRSYLTVGTAAVVGAGAIALTPALPGSAVHSAYLPAPVTAEVTLTGLNLSFTDIVGILGKFGVLDLGGLSPILNLLPTDLLDAITTQFMDAAGPVLKETAGEVFKYVATAATQLFIGKDSIPNQILGAVLHAPAVIGAAIGELRNGDPGAAVQALTAGLLAPITVIGQVLKQAVDQFTAFMETTLGSVASELAPVLISVVTSVVGNQLGGGLQTILDGIKNLFGALPKPGASVLAVAPAAASVVVDVPAAVVEAPAPVTRAHAPRAAAAVRAAKAAATEDVSESAAPQADPEQSPAPVARARGSLRSAIADEIAGNRAERAARNAEHPRAAASRAR